MNRPSREPGQRSNRCPIANSGTAIGNLVYIRRMQKIVAWIAFLFPLTFCGQKVAIPGARIYQQHCTMCHDSGAARMPNRKVLQRQTSAAIEEILTSGVMRQQGSMLTSAERAAVAEWLGRTPVAEQANFSSQCKGAPLGGAAAPSWTSWGNGVANLRFQSAQAAGLTAANVPQLRLKWAFAAPGVTLMRAQPAVFAGRLIFAAGSAVYALDPRTGCTYWNTHVTSPVRSAIAIASPAGIPLAFFGDQGGSVHAVEVASGKPVWQVHVDVDAAAMVTGTPVYYRKRLYVPVSSYEELAAIDPHYVCCTFRGSVLALDASTGRTLWKTYTVTGASQPRTTKKGVKSLGPSGAAVWSAPTIDAEKDLLYAATGDNYSDPPTKNSDVVLALSLETGKIAWARQFHVSDAYNMSCGYPNSPNCPDAAGPDFDFGSSPILERMPDGHRLLILAEKSGAVYAINPDAQGAPVWSAQMGHGGALGGIEWGPASDGQRLYAAVSDEAFLPSTKGMKLDPEKGGGLFALSLNDGKQVWYTPPEKCGTRQQCSPAQPGAVTAIPGATFSGSLDGHIRAFSSADGTLLWNYDTEHDYPAVNHAPGHGGAVNGPGPVIAGGMVFVLSGYDMFGEAPGNMLLAFTVDGR
ncbi:MAG: outer membrane protein assembly factor BamB family protein [Acidobacteriaceae bacterium]